MRKIIITGFSGFVARHYLDYLRGQRENGKILGLDVAEPKFDLDGFRDVLNLDFRTVNLLDEDAVKEIIADFRPTEILHLAAFSSVSYSWAHPADCFNNNTRVFLSVVEAVRTLGIETRVLSVGSSEVYGNVTEDQLPLREEMPIRPLSPYAIARQSQEKLAELYTEHFGSDIILTRSFNHIGPRQDTRFVVPSFIARALELKRAGKSGGEIETGDTTITRDFLDVRDVVRAYDLLLQKEQPGQTYNICSGKEVGLSGIIRELSDILGMEITGKVNPQLVRPDDNKRVVGSGERLQRDTGWRPEISLRQTLEDMIYYMESEEKGE